MDTESKEYEKVLAAVDKVDILGQKNMSLVRSKKIRQMYLHEGGIMDEKHTSRLVTRRDQQWLSLTPYLQDKTKKSCKNNTSCRPTQKVGGRGPQTVAQLLRGEFEMPVRVWIIKNVRKQLRGENKELNPANVLAKQQHVSLVLLTRMSFFKDAYKTGVTMYWDRARYKITGDVKTSPFYGKYTDMDEKEYRAHLKSINKQVGELYVEPPENEPETVEVNKGGEWANVTSEDIKVMCKAGGVDLRACVTQQIMLLANDRDTSPPPKIKEIFRLFTPPLHFITDDTRIQFLNSVDIAIDREDDIAMMSGLADDSSESDDDSINFPQSVLQILGEFWNQLGLSGDWERRDEYARAVFPFKTWMHPFVNQQIGFWRDLGFEEIPDIVYEDPMLTDTEQIMYAPYNDWLMNEFKMQHISVPREKSTPKAPSRHREKLHSNTNPHRNTRKPRVKFSDAFGNLAPGDRKRVLEKKSMYDPSP
jgi:hypothetical protein